MTIKTRFTKALAVKQPIALALMTPVSSGTLASAVAEAGVAGPASRRLRRSGLVRNASAKVTRTDVGVGFITWTIPHDPGLLGNGRCPLYGRRHGAPLAISSETGWNSGSLSCRLFPKFSRNIMPFERLTSMWT